MHFRRLVPIVSAVLSFALLPSARAETVVFLVRHAEKVDESRDPELSARGKARAASLAEMLKDGGIEAIYSTDFIRTRETALPIAQRLSKTVQIYDGNDLRSLARRLREESTRALVVGHSDTTPELVRLLGGEPGAPIAADEYDRLYLLVVGANGRTSTTLLRLSPPLP